MDYLLLGYFAIFSLGIILYLRHYVQRIGLHRIHTFIQDKELELNKKLVSGVTELEDISINLEVDVKKYQQLKEQFNDYLTTFDKRKYALDDAFKKLDVFFHTIRKQNQALEHAHGRNDKLLAELRTSEDTICLYEERLQALGKSFQQLKNELALHDDRATKQWEQFTHTQEQKTAVLAAELGEQLLAVITEKQTVFLQKVADVEQEFTTKLDNVTVKHAAQEKAVAAQTETMTSKLRAETTAHFADERTHFAAAKETLAKELADEMENLTINLHQTLKDTEEEIQKTKDQLTLANDLLLPYEERIEELEDKLGNCEHSWQVQQEDYAKWQKVFTKDKDQFMKKTFKTHFANLETESGAALQTLQDELASYRDKQKASLVTECDAIKSKLSKELQSLLYSPQRVGELEKAVRTAKEQLDGTKQEITSLRAKWQDDIEKQQQRWTVACKEHEKVLGQMTTAHANQTHLAYEEQLAKQKTQFEQQWLTLKEQLTGQEQNLKELENQTLANLRGEMQTQMKAFHTFIYEKGNKYHTLAKKYRTLAKKNSAQLDVFTEKVQSHTQATERLEKHLATTQARFTKQLRVRDEKFADLEKTHLHAIKTTLTAAQQGLEKWVRASKKTLKNTVHATEKRLDTQQRDLNQLTSRLEKEWVPAWQTLQQRFDNEIQTFTAAAQCEWEESLAKLKTLRDQTLEQADVKEKELVTKLEQQAVKQFKAWEQRFKQTLSADFQHMETTHAAIKEQLVACDKNFMTSAAHQKEILENLDEQAKKQLETWEKQFLAKIVKETTTLAQTRIAVQEQLTHLEQQLQTIDHHNLAELNARSVEIDQKLTALESAYQHYDRIFKESNYYERDFKRFIEDITEKLHSDIDEFKQFLTHEKTTVEKWLKEKTQIEHALEDIKTLINSDELTREKNAVLQDFATFLEAQKTHIQRFVEQKLHHIQDLGRLDELEDIVIDAHAPVNSPSPAAKNTAENTEDTEDALAAALPMFGKLPAAHTPQEAKKAKHASPAERKTARTMELKAFFSHILEPKLRLRTVNMFTAGKVDKMSPQQLKGILKDFEQRMNTKIDKFEKVYTLESNLSNKALVAETQFSQYFTAAQEKIKQALKQFHHHLHKQSQTQLAEVTNSLVSEETRIVKELQAKSTDYKHHFAAELTATRERLAAFLQKSRQEFSHYRNAAITDYASRINDQLAEGKKHWYATLQTLEHQLKQSSEKLFKQQTQRLAQSNDAYQLSTQKLAQFHTNVNTIAVMEARHEKLLKKASEHYAQVEMQLKNFVKSASVTEKLKNLLTIELETQLKAKAKRLETQFFSQKNFRHHLELTLNALLAKKESFHGNSLPRAVETSLRKELHAKVLHPALKQLTQEVSAAATKELRAQIITTQTQWKTLADQSTTFMTGQKRDVKLFMTQTEKLVTTHNEQLVASFTKKLRFFDKELSQLVKQVKAFTAQTKALKQADALHKAITEKTTALSTQLATLTEREKQFKNLDTKLTTAIEREKKLLGTVKDLKKQEKSVHDLANRLDETLENSATLAAQLLELKAHQQALRKFSDETKSYEKLLNNVKQEWKELRAQDHTLKDTHTALKTLLNDQKRLAIETERLDKSLHHATQGESTIRSKFKALEQQAAILENHYKDFKVFDEKYNQLDYLLEDMEQRQRAVEEMRKKLSVDRGELEALKKDFNEQISMLLKVLYQRPSHSAATARGTDAAAATKAPQAHLNKLATVERLHAIGWSNREISDHLNITTYEVEIILKQSRK